MRNRLIAAVLSLFGTLTGVQAAPDVTSEITYDLTSGKADYYFWKDEASAGNNGYIQYECSYPDPQQTCTANENIPIVQIYLTKQRSGIRRPIRLKGFKTAVVSNDEAPPGYKGGRGLQANLKDSSGSSCTEDGQHYYIYDTKFLTPYPEQTEVKDLLISGVWKGKVKLYSNSPAQDYFTSIALNTLDPNHIDMFFPEFVHATPKVQLDLHPTGSVSGSSYAQDLTMLDMCLYDGFNGNTISYEIMLKDEGRPTAGCRDGYFSIYRQGETTTDGGERIDYRVKVHSPETGGQVNVRNNENMVWNGINLKRVRPVVLSGIRYAVMYMPTPLILAVNKFNVMDKQTGYYMGKSSVVFTPSLPTIN